MKNGSRSRRSRPDNADLFEEISVFQEFRALAGLALVIALVAWLNGRTSAPTKPLHDKTEIASLCDVDLSRSALADRGTTSPAAGSLIFGPEKAGAPVAVYFDHRTAALARHRGPCIAGELAALASFLPVRSVQHPWRPIGLILPEPTPKSRKDAAPAAVDDFLFRTVPHEEAHVYQPAYGSIDLPHWFREGQAEWASLKVVQSARPDLARARILQMKDSLQREKVGDLRQWRDRQKQGALSGPILFHDPSATDGDCRSTASLARRLAALNVFLTMERRHGQAAVQAWTADVFKGGSEGTAEALAVKHFGEALGRLLQD